MHAHVNNLLILNWKPKFIIFPCYSACIYKDICFSCFLNKQYTVMIGDSFCWKLMSWNLKHSRMSDLLQYILDISPTYFCVIFFYLKQLNVFTLLVGGVMNWGGQYFKKKTTLQCIFNNRMYFTGLYMYYIYLKLKLYIICILCHKRYICLLTINHYYYYYYYLLAYLFINWVIWFRHDFNQSTCDL